MSLLSKPGVARQPDPAPLETNDAAIVAAGTACWVLALLVLGIARLTGADVQTWWLAMCGCGAALGLIGVRYCGRRQRAIARDRAIAADKATGDQAANSPTN